MVIKLQKDKNIIIKEKSYVKFLQNNILCSTQKRNK